MDKYEAAQVLGVEAAKTLDEVKKAWHAAARKWHPQHCEGAEGARRFRQCEEAWDVLRKLWRLSPKAFPIGRRQNVVDTSTQKPQGRDVPRWEQRLRELLRQQAPAHIPHQAYVPPPPQVSEAPPPPRPRPPADPPRAVYVPRNRQQFQELIGRPHALVGNRVEHVLPTGTPLGAAERGAPAPTPRGPSSPNTLGLLNKQEAEARLGQRMGQILVPISTPAFERELHRALQYGSGTVHLPAASTVRSPSGTTRSVSGMGGGSDPSVLIRDGVAYAGNEPHVLIVMPR